LDCNNDITDEADGEDGVPFEYEPGGENTEEDTADEEDDDEGRLGDITEDTGNSS
jgi:hypothetical protein